MKNILALCFFPAFAPPTNGGESRVFQFYRALSEHHKVVLITSSHPNIAEERVVHGIHFIERRIPKDHHFYKQWQQWAPFGSGGDLSAPVIAASSTYPTLLHKAYLEEYDAADIIVHDFPFLQGYDLFRGMDNKPRVYNAHNCETALYKQLHPGVSSRNLHKLVRRTEAALLRNVDLVLYCNEEDLGMFRKMTRNSFCAHYAPNGTLIPPLNNIERRDPQCVSTALFMGSAHPPNRAAALYIAAQLAPQFPSIEFRFIGSCLPEGTYLPNVKCFGFVSETEKDELLRCSDIALNPMTAGSGSSLKILEYFANSLPVISTEFGMRGILARSGVHYIASTIEEFKSTLQCVLNRPSPLREIGIAGRKLACEHYSWRGIAAAAAKQLSSLSDKKNRRITPPKLLVLNDYESFSAIGGGGTRTRGLYNGASRNQPVVFLSFSATEEISVRRRSKSITTVAIPKSKAHQDCEMQTNSAFHISCNDIVASQHCMANWFLNRVYQVLRRYASLVVIEHCYMAPLPISYDDRFIYSSQNAESRLKRQMLQWHPMGEKLLPYLECLEARTVRLAAATMAVCEDDAEAFLSMTNTAGSIMVISNGAETPPSDEKLAPVIATLGREISSRSAVFVGSAHGPNLECAIFIRDRLSVECPDVQFHIIGGVSSALGNTEALPPNLRIWGILDSVQKSAIMQACAIAINPMTSGGGSNVKLADYIANGLFVVTTEFGRRGYPTSIDDHLLIAPLHEFSNAVNAALGPKFSIRRNSRSGRQELFARELSSSAMGERFAKLLRITQGPKKRVLFVSYRYVAPPLGGAEAMMESLVRTLGESGEFLVDIVAPEVSGMQNISRFSEKFEFSTKNVLIDVPNLRHKHFPLDESYTDDALPRLWDAQIKFERELSKSIRRRFIDPGLDWGWAEVSQHGEQTQRWAYSSCGIHTVTQGRISLTAITDVTVFVCAYDEGGALLQSVNAEAGEFVLDFYVSTSGPVEIVTSRTALDPRIDPRPLGFRAVSLHVDGHPIDLHAKRLSDAVISSMSAEERFRLLAHAAELTRFRANTRLTDARGPFSKEMEAFIENNIDKYDLLVTNNNIFRPAVFAIDIARRKGVPSILIPHSHFDDDYYHFPDILESARSASFVLAAPKAACDFLSEQGCFARYLPAGIDTDEPFSSRDVDRFQRMRRSERPFLLVLGRKAAAKNYKDVIAAVEQLSDAGAELDVVLIGPDDDGLEIRSHIATYFGRQPRDVVRGALLSCLALVNMSSSESFGIVLLEAWLAGKPVVANKLCAAFADLAIHEVNALLVEQSELKSALLQIVESTELRVRLAEAGRLTAAEYDTKLMSKRFIEFCHQAIKGRGQLREDDASTVSVLPTHS